MLAHTEKWERLQHRGILKCRVRDHDHDGDGDRDGLSQALHSVWWKWNEEGDFCEMHIHVRALICWRSPLGAKAFPSERIRQGQSVWWVSTAARRACYCAVMRRCWLTHYWYFINVKVDSLEGSEGSENWHVSSARSSPPSESSHWKHWGKTSTQLMKTELLWVWRSLPRKENPTHSPMLLHTCEKHSWDC